MAVGDHWASTPSRATWLELTAVEPDRFLALRAPIDLHGGRPFDSSSPRPFVFNATVWCFWLDTRAWARSS